MSEYDWPGTVIVCSPSSDDPGFDQHEGLVSKLRSLGVTVLCMPHVPQLAAQEFTRDVGFVIGGVLFSGLLHSHRAQEREAFHLFCDQLSLPYVSLRTHIEGGDVIVDQNKHLVFLGQSGRTAADAAVELQNTLRRHVSERWTVIPVPFPLRFLHLDCVFCPLGPSAAIAYLQAFELPTRTLLRKYYPTIVSVTNQQQVDLACNVVGLGHASVVCGSEALQVTTSLESKLVLDLGLHLHPLHLDSFIQRRGSVRCLTLPLRQISSTLRIVA